MAWYTGRCFVVTTEIPVDTLRDMLEIVRLVPSVSFEHFDPYGYLWFLRAQESG